MNAKRHDLSGPFRITYAAKVVFLTVLPDGAAWRRLVFLLSWPSVLAIPDALL